MNKFEDKNWKDFFLTDFFHCEKGNQNNMASLNAGDIPLVSAKKCDNGYKDFVAFNGKKHFKGGIITLNNDGDGGAGIAYYQPYKMALDSHVTALIPKQAMSRYILLFVAMCITKQRKRFGHGYSLNSNRLRSFKMMLPLNQEKTVPDWHFMEEYMKQKEQQILKPTIDELCKRLIINDILAGGGGKLLCSNWKAFYFTEVFAEIQRGKRLKKADHEEGKTPYVSSTSLNNGIDGFIGNDSSVRRFDDCLTLANSGSVGCAFYHQYTFVASDHVTKLKREGLDKHAYLFMIPIINRLSEKYSFNREINDERIKREKLLLPATDKGEIDFAFMSAFMKEVEHNILDTTLKVFKERVSVNKSKNWGGVNWKNFLLRDLFPTLVAGKSKGLNHIEKSDSGISYLGATNQNNGVLCFVCRDESTIQKGNCIAFIRNGEGSMGYSVYKAEDFIATSDMTLGYNKHLNRYIGTFITTIADRVRGKYNFGYKRSANRLFKEIITLPVDNNGSPDWEYMENYMRNIESEQILKYLYSINCRNI